MKRQALFAASAFALMSIAQPATAQQYGSYHDEHVAAQQCQQSRNNRTVGGAIIGGLAGAILGHNVAGGRGSRDEGRALGAVVGAVAGGAIGRNSANCSTQVQGSYDPYYGQAQYPDDGYYGGRDDEYYGDDDYAYRNEDSYRGDCRPGEVITRDRYGREYRERVTMCRDRDGVWRPA
jgi:uncharacterized protein YcfJ